MSSLFILNNVHQSLINISIDNFNDYVLKMEEFLEAEVENFNKSFEKQTKGWSEQDKDEYGEYLSDEYCVLAETYPNFLRSSMFFSIYSFFEKELKDICTYCKKNMNINTFYDKKLSKISNSLLCLEQCFEIKFSLKIDEWKKIDGVYREIRNIIAHDGGEIDRNKLDNYTSLFEGFPIEVKGSTGELLPKKELCLLSLKDMKAFFKQFFTLINENQ